VNNFRLTEALVNDHLVTLRADANRARVVRSAHRARFRRRGGRASYRASRASPLTGEV
jgi:hypothetical protein